MAVEQKGFLPRLIDRIVMVGVKPVPWLSETEIRAIIDDQLNPAPIVNPQEFLARPRGVEVGRLSSSPDVELLSRLPTLENEVALVFQNSTWHIIKSVGLEAPGWHMSEDSDIHIHSHPTAEITGSDPHSSFLPSYQDFLNASPRGREFIISEHGITQYWPVQDLQGRQELAQGLEQHKPGHEGLTVDDYLELLQRVNARFTLHRIFQEKLTLLFGHSD